MISKGFYSKTLSIIFSWLVFCLMPAVLCCGQQDVIVNIAELKKVHYGSFPPEATDEDINDLKNRL